MTQNEPSNDDIAGPEQVTENQQRPCGIPQPERHGRIFARGDRTRSGLILWSTVHTNWTRWQVHRLASSTMSRRASTIGVRRRGAAKKCVICAFKRSECRGNRGRLRIVIARPAAVTACVALDRLVLLGYKKTRTATPEKDPVPHRP